MRQTATQLIFTLMDQLGAWIKAAANPTEKSKLTFLLSQIAWDDIASSAMRSGAYARALFASEAQLR